MRNSRIFSYSLLIVACTVFAENNDKTIETGWLLPEAGYTEEIIGARVDSVTETETDGEQKIIVSLPRRESTLEEVIVIGKRKKAVRPLIQTQRFEYINDPELGRYGIIIYLGKREQFALKLNYYEVNPRFPYD